MFSFRPSTWKAGRLKELECDRDFHAMQFLVFLPLDADMFNDTEYTARLHGVVDRLQGLDRAVTAVPVDHIMQDEAPS